jgi:multidrug efflux pump subunit AcrA (membrane-fusion protein)
VNDDVKAAIERFREWHLYGSGAADHRTVIDWLDGEPARLAAAREEQREACWDVVSDNHDEPYSKTLRAIASMPLTATPLADEITALRARVAELEAEALRQRLILEGQRARLCGASARAETAEAERDELRAWPCEHSACDLTLGDVADAPCGDEPSHPDGRLSLWYCGRCWRREVGALRAERDALRARVAELEDERVARDDIMTAEQRLKFWAENPHACPIHFGARTACGQCFDSVAQQLANERVESAATLNDLRKAEAEAERDALRAQTSLTDGPCVECGKPTQWAAGDPGQWVVMLPTEAEPGVAKHHHVKCVLGWRAQVEAARAGLNVIAAWSEGPEVCGTFDEPCSAQYARDTLRAMDEAKR